MWRNAKVKRQDTTPSLSSPGSEVLVPLTSSLYVPGKLVNPDSLLVDVGTGFYVKKTREAAGEVMHTKLTFVKDKADQLQYLVEQKAQQMQQVTTSEYPRHPVRCSVSQSHSPSLRFTALQQKVQAYEAAQKAGGAAPKAA